MFDIFHGRLHLEFDGLGDISERTLLGIFYIFDRDDECLIDCTLGRSRFRDVGLFFRLRGEA